MPQRPAATAYEGLALSRGNVGYDMLTRLGYTPGMPLGAAPAEGALVEPLSVTVKVGRGGLGRPAPAARLDLRAVVKAEAADFAAVSTLVGDIYKPRCRWCGWAGTAAGGRKLYRHERRCGRGNRNSAAGDCLSSMDGSIMDTDDCGEASAEWGGRSPTSIRDMDYGGRAGASVDLDADEDADADFGADPDAGVLVSMAGLGLDLGVDVNVDRPFQPLRR
ncbi:hypothetical protein MMPV_005108 [Pyropia vietnamensis]